MMHVGLPWWMIQEQYGPSLHRAVFRMGRKPLDPNARIAILYVRQKESNLSSRPAETTYDAWCGKAPNATDLYTRDAMLATCKHCKRREAPLLFKLTFLFRVPACVVLATLFCLGRKADQWFDWVCDHTWAPRHPRKTDPEARARVLKRFVNNGL